MMDEPEYEIHPLDRDYSSPTPAGRGSPTSAPYGSTIEFDGKLRRLGFVVFASGFAVMFLVAMMLGSFPGVGLIESIGSAVHRLAMVTILIGGGMIIVAYRLPQLQSAGMGVSGELLRRTLKSAYGSLVLWNFVALIAITLASQLLRLITSRIIYFLVLNAALTITCALLATAAIWHRGLIRAYAMGALVALVINSVSSLVALSGGWFWGSAGFLLFANLVLVLVSGLVCAGYVYRLELSSSKKLGRIESQSK